MMRWVADPGPAGNWIGPLLDDDFGVVPHGFEAYARVFHPAMVSWLPDRPMPTSDELEQLSPSAQQQVLDALQFATVPWSAVAQAFGTTMHPLAQWHRLVRSKPMAGPAFAPDGRQFDTPGDGSMEPTQLAVMAAHLIAHTATPIDGFAALWEGYGGLVGRYDTRPSRVFFRLNDTTERPPMPAHYQDDPNAEPTWQPGILSAEISEGPRLQLPGRDYVLFSASPSAFTDPDWVLDAPWRDVEAERHGLEPSAQHPTMLWPADRAWITISDLDDAFTIVCGPATLIAEVCGDPDVEAFPIAEGSDLGWGGDLLN